MKICLAFSPGGHYTEMKKVIDAFKGHEIFYVTTDTKSTRDLKNVYYVRDSLGPTKIHMVLNFLVILIQSLIIILKEKPKVTVSSGADITIPIFYISKLFGAKVIFIESFCRVKDLSVTGKITYPIANLFIIQEEKLRQKYKKAKYWGTVL